MTKVACPDRSWNRIFSWPWSQKNQFIIILSWFLLLVCASCSCAIMLNRTLSSVILKGLIQTSSNLFRNDGVFWQLLLFLLCLKISQGISEWVSHYEWKAAKVTAPLCLFIVLTCIVLTLTHTLGAKFLLSNRMCVILII